MLRLNILNVPCNKTLLNCNHQEENHNSIRQKGGEWERESVEKKSKKEAYKSTGEETE